MAEIKINIVDNLSTGKDLKVWQKRKTATTKALSVSAKTDSGKVATPSATTPTASKSRYRFTERRAPRLRRKSTRRSLRSRTAPTFKLSEWLNIWLTSYAYIKVRPSTYASYQAYVERHVSPLIGGLQLQKLTTNQLQVFFNEKRMNGRIDGKGGLSPKTIRNMYNMLHEALQQAVINKILSVNVSEGVVLPSREEKEIIVFKPDEQRAIIEAARKDRLGFAIELDFFTGLRLGELCALKWSDIDLAAKEFRVRRTLQRVQKKSSDIKAKGKRTQIVEGAPKTKKGNRVIPLTDSMLQKLLVHRARQLFEKQRLGKAYNDNGYVFANEFGGLIEPNYLRKVYRRILKDAKVPLHHFHTIRHTFATRAIENDMPVKVVSEILGHSSVQLTMDLYCHPSVSAKRNVLEKMENL